MKNRVRTLCMLLSILMMVIPVSAGFAAPSTTDELDVQYEQVEIDPIMTKQTKEPPMPAVEKTEIKDETKTMELTTRANWVNETKTVLEAAYGQDVIKVREDENVIRFHFKTTEYKTSDILLDSKDLDQNTPFQILMVEYIKPESSMATKSMSTKIAYYYAWSSTFYSIDSASASSYLAAASVLIALIPYVNTSLAGVVNTVAAYIGSNILASGAVSANTRAKYYYQNKVGCVYSSGYWVPVVYVGSRRGFTARYAEWTTQYGQPIDDYKPAPTGLPEYNPTNYDGINYKSHFTDNTWIQNQAVYRYENGLGIYYDVYAAASNPVP